MDHATDGGLGRPILVVDLDGAPEGPGNVPRQLGFKILAAHNELANPGGAKVHVLDHRQVRGRELDDVEPAVLDDLEDRHARHLWVLAHHHDAATRNERREDRRHREIKRQRGEQRPGQSFTPTVLLLCPPDVVDEAAVLDHHALGCAGGARRVNDVGETVGGGRPPGIHHRCSRDRREVGVQRHDARGAQRHAAFQMRLSHQDRQGAGTCGGDIPQHEGEAFLRRRRIDGHVRGAGLEHAEDGAHHVDRVVHIQHHKMVRANAACSEMRCHLVRAVLELAIRQRLIGAVDGVVVWRAGDLGFKELHDGLVGRVWRGRVVVLAEVLIHSDDAIISFRISLAPA